MSFLPRVVSERSSVGLTLLNLRLDAPVKATFSSRSLSPLLLWTSSHPFSGFSISCGHFIKYIAVVWVFWFCPAQVFVPCLCVRCRSLRACRDVLPSPRGAPQMSPLGAPRAPALNASAAVGWCVRGPACPHPSPGLGLGLGQRGHSPVCLPIAVCRRCCTFSAYQISWGILAFSISFSWQ